MKVALVHDWLNGMRGGERVLEIFCELYPRADIFTLFLEPGKVSSRIRKMNIHTSFLQKLPFTRRGYRSYLPLFPRAVESFDLKGYDLVVSTSHAVAKGCRPLRSAVNICYCFTPMRYIWFMYEEYFGKNPLKKMLLTPIIAYLRRWDRRSSDRVDRFVAISKNVAGRIERIYNHRPLIVYPPVDADFFHPAGERKDYFLIVSALVPYKRVDLAVSAFSRLGLPLKIIGSGPRADQLASIAGDNIEFLGWVRDEELREYYRGCRALIFPGEEDFGIVPLEAMACGRPVIGLGKGGLLETVVGIDNPAGTAPTGIFFSEPVEESLGETVEKFIRRENEFDPEAIRDHAVEFNRRRFKNEIKTAIETIIKDKERKSST